MRRKNIKFSPRRHKYEWVDSCEDGIYPHPRRKGWLKKDQRQKYINFLKKLDKLDEKYDD